jgi:hypothetical protein
MEGLVILVFLAVWVGISWLFYLWGAAIAEGKGRSRALGWWAVFFGLLAILVLALLPNEQSPTQYVAHNAAPKASTAKELERLAALKERGAISEAEFDERKQSLLGRG